jgi:proline racemase
MTHRPLHLEPPDGWLKIETIDMHTGGEPLRVIVSGLPAIAGCDVLEKRRYFRQHLDHLRTGLMFEPRGHADMYGAVLNPSLTADFDVFFLHNEGYSTMCGHAILALTRLVIEAGRVTGPEVCFAVPAGRIEARARVEHGRIVSTSFRNVPSFVYRRDESLSVEGFGTVRFDVAYGGAFYAVVDASPLGLELAATNVTQLVDAGRRIKHAVMRAIPIEHPFERDLSFLYGTIFTGPAEDKAHHSRNVCIFADGEVDRSPTGSGVSARAERAGGASSCQGRARCRPGDHDRKHPWDHDDRTRRRADDIWPLCGRGPGGLRHGARHRPSRVLVRPRRSAQPRLHLALNRRYRASSSTPALATSERPSPPSPACAMICLRMRGSQ